MGTAGFLSVAQTYETFIYGAFWTPVQMIDGVVQGAMVVPALFMAASFFSKLTDLFSSKHQGFSMLDAVNIETFRAGQVAAAIGGALQTVAHWPRTGHTRPPPSPTHTPAS